MSHDDISLRDWFAGQSMCTMFYPAVMESMRTDEDINCDKIADLAYKIADAMLIKRAKDGSIK